MFQQQSLIDHITDIARIKDVGSRFLEASEAFAHSAQNSLSVIFGVAPDGTTLFVSQAVETVTGYTSEALLGKNWWEMLYPGRLHAQVEGLFEKLQSGSVTDFNMTLLTRTGEPRTIRWNVLQKQDEQGNILEIIGVGLDATHRLLAENELRRQNEELANLIQTKTALLIQALEREHLYRRIVDIASQSFDIQFIASSMAHELGRFFKADRCLILRYERHNGSGFLTKLLGEYRYSEDIPSILPEDIPWQTEQLMSDEGQINRSGVFLKITNPNEMPAVLHGFYKKYEVQAALLLEIHYRGLPYGRLVFHQCKATRDWTQDEIDFLEMLGTHVGVALYQAELYRQEQLARFKAETAEERYRMLIEGITDHAIVMISPEGKVATWNVGAERMSGYDEEEIIGQHFSRFYTEEDVQSGKTAHALQVAQREGRYEEIGWRVRQDGSRYWANVMLTPLYNTHGQLAGFSKIIRDMTEKKEAEEQIEKILRTSLRKDQFLASTSHELRTPLHTIITGSNMLQDGLLGPLNEKQSEYIAMIRSSGEHLLYLINELLDIAKIEAGKLSLNIQANDLREFIDQALLPVMPLIHEKNLRFSLHLAENLPESFQGDPIRLKQVLFNLLSNAIKFTSSGKELQLHCYASEDKRMLVLSVRDEGFGIYKSDLKRIFEPFEQGTQPQEGGYIKGTGLGLSLAQRIVEMHQGTIQVKSEVGVGSEFSVYLPLTSLVLN